MCVHRPWVPGASGFVQSTAPTRRDATARSRRCPFASNGRRQAAHDRHRLGGRSAAARAAALPRHQSCASTVLPASSGGRACKARIRMIRAFAVSGRYCS
jgi:hypothetical protein